ncbi:uncharacterized protein LOC129742740 [Uranotaenia lowii]|uniref:uncharacterized protein LOC129742740 n=1 Tax=Uranotaenia lowii TaxID=190385 RepID=UPI00247995E7|nr:uncharacterized protein LOC129742740 [Uranotaenia lowii]
MGYFIRSFLTERKARVYIDGKLSSPHTIANGVPQGSVLAPTLFLIGMQSLFDVVPEDVNVLAYADDITLISVSPYSVLSRKQLQIAVNRVDNWAPSMGFIFAPEKSKLMHLSSRKKKLNKLPPLIMGNKVIPIVHSSRILGVLVDDKLKFINHANQVRKSASLKLNILKKLCSARGAGSRSSLFRFLHGWLMPAMLHGLGLFSRGGDRINEKLEPLYNQAVRIIGGAFRSSPIVSIMAESGQIPFDYVIARNLSSKTIRWLSYNRNPEVPMVQRTESYLQKYETSIPEISTRPEPRLRKFNAPVPKVDLSLLSAVRAGGSSTVALANYLQLVSRKYQSIPKFFTDGSKSTDGQVGCGIFSTTDSVALSLPPKCSVFSSEAFAILKAAQDLCPSTGAVIFSDSASVLRAVQAANTKHPWIIALSNIAATKKITLCWIPGHSGIPGNEAADRLALNGSQLEPPNTAIPPSDASHWLKNHLLLSWANTWNNITENKLREIKNCTYAWSDRNSFFERRALTRIRIGHTRLTHGYLMGKEDPPICPACSVVITIKHILTQCPIHQQARLDCDLADNLRQILSNDPEEEEKVLSFLRSSSIYEEI